MAASSCWPTAKPLQAGIRLLLGDENHLSQSTGRAVAAAVRSCIVDYANNTENWRRTLDLLRMAQGLTANAGLLERLREDVQQVQARLTEEREYEELKKAVGSNKAWDVTISSEGARVAPVCTCCLGTPTGETTVSQSWEEVHGLTRYRRTLSLAFPVCAQCLRHQSEYGRKRLLLVALASGISVLCLLAEAKLASGAQWLPLVTVGAVLTTVLLFILSRFIRLSQLADDHACRSSAVEMRGASAAQVTLRFHNPLYAHAFARANGATVAPRAARKPSRRPNLLEGRSDAVSLVLAAVVLAGVGHTVVYSTVAGGGDAAPVARTTGRSGSVGAPNQTRRRTTF